MENYQDTKTNEIVYQLLQKDDSFQFYLCGYFSSEMNKDQFFRQYVIQRLKDNTK